MLGAFAGEGGGPVDAGHDVIVNWGGGGDVGHIHVLGAIAYAKKFLDTFICC